MRKAHLTRKTSWTGKIGQNRSALPSTATANISLRKPGHFRLWSRLRCLLGLGLLLAATGCGNDSPTPILIGTNVWPGYEPLYLAQTRGLLRDQDARLIQYPSASEVIRAFRNGTISAAAVTLDEALLMAADGMKSKVVLVFDASQGADIILAHPGFERLEDLRDHRVGVEASALGAFVLCRAAELHQMDCHKDFQMVNLEVNEHETAFETGKVDAVVTFEPARTHLLAEGAHAVFDSREIPDEIIDVLVVRPEILTQSKPKLQALLKGWYSALALMASTPEASAATMGQRQQLSAKEFLASLNGLHIPDREETLGLIGGPKPVLADSLLQLARIMSDHGLLPPSPATATDSLRDMLASGPVEDLQP